MFLQNFCNKLNLCAPKHARTQSQKTLIAVILNITQTTVISKKMDKRKYLLFQGWAYALVVVVLTVIFALQKTDESGVIFGIAFLSFLAYKSYSCFKELKNTRDEDRDYAPSTDSTIAEKISFYKRMLLIGVPAFIITSIWTYLDLKSLESGTVDSVLLWEPVSLLYNLGGFWLAVLATPLLGVFIVILGLRKIKELNNTEQ